MQRNIRDAILLHLGDRIESGEKIPRARLYQLNNRGCHGMSEKLPRVDINPDESV
jgi:hypothetical protein